MVGTFAMETRILETCIELKLIGSLIQKEKARNQQMLKTC
jgi:hypothetical protein